MQSIKLFLLSCMIILCNAKVSAYTALINGIYYNFKGTEAIVTNNGKWNTPSYYPSVTIPEEVYYNGQKYKVTTIDSYAFYGSSGLKSVSLPNTITKIGLGAFYYCKELLNVNIPDGVKELGTYAFEGCSGLSSINLPSSIETIGYGAFSSCGGLTSITVSSNNTRYDSRDNCNAIIETSTNRLIAGCRNTAIPNTITSIGEFAFSYRSGLTEINIPEGVTAFGENAFCGCTDLVAVNLPSTTESISFGLFQDCSSLHNIDIPANVKDIGQAAFSGCSSLQSVIVHSVNPLEIESKTFSNRANATLYVPTGSKSAYKAADYWKEFKEIVEVAVPSPAIVFADANVKAISVANWDTDGDGELSEDEAAAVTELGTVFQGNKTIICFDELQYFSGLTTIDNYAFRDCGNLNSVTIGKSVTSIGVDAFNGCSSLTSITIPDGMIYIGMSAFSDCSSLTSVTIPNSVKTISYNAFSNCVSLTSVKIPSSMTAIANGTFLGCRNLTSVEIPDGVTSIGIQAFYNCSSLASLPIPGSVTTIGGSAFCGCSSLSSIMIPNSVTSIGSNLFENCSSLSSISVDAGNTIYDSRDNCNAIIETSSNTLIAGCKNTVIPNSITNIAEYAFCGCSGLTSIAIPKSVTTIGKSAFENCNNLTTVIVEMEKPVSIDLLTFTNSINATLYVPAGSKAAYEAADYWNKFKEIVEVSPALTFADANVKALCIANWDEDGNGELSEAEAAAVTDIGNVFKGNKTITSFDELQLFTGLKNIGESAFYSCSSLTSVIIPSSILSIDRSAFCDCSALTSISIPNSVTSIGEYTFQHCSSLVSVTIPDNVKKIEQSVFESCSSLTSVTIPNSVVRIEGGAFAGCSALTSVAIPNSVTFIGDGAFNGCNSLTSVTIPDGVTYIGSEAFYGCNGLVSVTVEREKPISIDSNTFTNRDNATLYVPAGCKAVYESADVWKEFKEIIEMGDSDNPTEIDVTDISALDNVIYMDAMEVKAASQATVSLKMKNSEQICAFQFDLCLPEGVTVAKNSRDMIQGALNDGRLYEGDNHTLTSSELEDGIVRVVCTSSNNLNFVGNEGEIATLKVNIADDMIEGDYAIRLKDIKLVKDNADKIYRELVQSKLTVVSYIPGDANGDGEVDVADVVAIVNYILEKPADNFNQAAADVNHDEVIDAADVVGVVNIILDKGSVNAARVREVLRENGFIF